MDPNATLETIRSIVSEIMENDSGEDAFRDLTEEADNLAEAFLALDEWLTKGGFLPGEWKR